MALDDVTTISVEIVYATPQQQRLLALQVPAGTDAGQAIQLSGLLTEFPELDAANLAVGIFAQVCPLSQILKAGDRLEIYRPLRVDPKSARLQRAGRNAKK
jgi:uncharacterized protein